MYLFVYKSYYLVDFYTKVAAMRASVTNIMMVRMKKGEVAWIMKPVVAMEWKMCNNHLTAPVLVSSTLGYKYSRWLFAGKLMIYNLSGNFIKYGQLGEGELFLQSKGLG